MEERRAWVVMRDGIRLAARLWIPAETPAPVVLEALPYRMDDLTSSYCSEYERLCEEGGFAVCRLDIRGTGSSEGIAEDEYTQAELDDICEVIAWLAGQEWSNGRVGMYGASWSGFNSIQVACLRPPALAAIVPIYSTDDRYTDDVHYMGGVVKAVDLVDWVTYMIACNMLPPVPAVFGDGWREEWLRRIDGTDPWVLRWLEEQHDGPYWRHGSLRPEYGRIACPTMIVAGWADGYRNNTLRTFAALECPKRLLIGPWSHMSTATSVPGPHIDLVAELVRWFGRWLRDDDNGIDAEPPVVNFARRSTRPGAGPGRDAWRVAHRADLACGAAAADGVARRRERSRPDPRPRRRRHDRLDLLRRQAPLGAAARPASRRRLLAGLRLGAAARGAPDPRPPTPEPDARPVVPRCSTCPRGCATSFPTGRRRSSRAASSTSRTARGTPGHYHWSRASRPRSTSSSRRPRGRSSPAIACGWPLRGRTGRTPGRRRPAGTIGVDRSSVELELPVLQGASPTPAPKLAATTGEDAHTPHSDEPEPPTIWTIAHDVLDRRTRVVISHGSVYPAPYDGRVTEQYDGEVGVSTVDPADASAQATALYRVSWPEADVVSEARLDVLSDAEAYHVTVDVVVEEVGDSGIGRRERRFERVIPRRLA